MRILITLEDEWIESMASMISAAFKRGATVFIAGNGGSFADSQHMVAELCCTYLDKNRKGFSAIALGTNSSITTAWSNDNGYETAFARELEALGKPGDIFIGITTSGGSKNIINALEKAKELGLYTILLTGKKYNNQWRKCIDYTVVIDSGNTPRIQESHIALIHEVCDLVEQKMKVE